MNRPTLSIFHGFIVLGKPRYESQVTTQRFTKDLMEAQSAQLDMMNDGYEVTITQTIDEEAYRDAMLTYRLWEQLVADTESILGHILEWVATKPNESRLAKLRTQYRALAQGQLIIEMIADLQLKPKSIQGKRLRQVRWAWPQFDTTGHAIRAPKVDPTAKKELAKQLTAKREAEHYSNWDNTRPQYVLVPPAWETIDWEKAVAASHIDPTQRTNAEKALCKTASKMINGAVFTAPVSIDDHRLPAHVARKKSNGYGDPLDNQLVLEHGRQALSLEVAADYGVEVEG